MASSDSKTLILSILQFLRKEAESSSLSTDSKESLSVSIQCLECAYSIEDADRNSIDNAPNLLTLFCKNSEAPKKVVTEDMKVTAEGFKVQGNNYMKEECFEKAIEQYDEAIKLDPYNAFYYSNRAAALSKIGRHEAAIEDCKKAIEIDSNYSKAYSRMGLAYANLNNQNEARNCYQKAVEIEPNNENYVRNLQTAEEKIKEESGTAPPAGQMPAGLPDGMNFGNLLNNPALMNMASTLMNNPTMQNMMSNIVSSMSGSNDGSGSNPPSGGPNPSSGGLDDILQVGQRLASQMQSANPELIEQLRQQMQNSSAPTQPPQDPNDPKKDT